MTATYRPGGHGGRTIVAVGAQPADSDGRRPDDQLVGVMDDPALAAQICELLNTALAAPPEPRSDPCPASLHTGRCYAARTGNNPDCPTGGCVYPGRGTTRETVVAALDHRAGALRAAYRARATDYSIEYINGFEDAAAFAEDL